MFYVPDIQPHHRQFLLNEEESKHAIRVLRLVAGAKIHLVDGAGGWYEAEIIDPHPKRTALRILALVGEYQKPAYRLHIALAPTKNIERTEWFLEKATEVGIQEITPLLCERSERREIKPERLNKVLVAAMKQSLKAYLPKLNPAVPLAQFLDEQRTNPAAKAIAHCASGNKRFLSQILEPQGEYLILIGPEGDFSPREIDQALALGYQPTSLGNSRLRTETAALASCMEVALLQRMMG